jgi:hypothetical protein
VTKRQLAAMQRETALARQSRKSVAPDADVALRPADRVHFQPDRGPASRRSRRIRSAPSVAEWMMLAYVFEHWSLRETEQEQPELSWFDFHRSLVERKLTGFHKSYGFRLKETP